MSAARLLREVRVHRRLVSPGRWQDARVAPRGSTQLGISFRPLQAEAMGLDPLETLDFLLPYPFELVRVPAYWSRIEEASGERRFEELDRHVDAAERAGKQVIVGVGAIKNFGYPEFFAPRHRLPRPFREGNLVRAEEHAQLLEDAVGFVSQVVERYRNRKRIVAWQVEHEAVDPLGMEHSWRLQRAFVECEINTVRRLDPRRPVLLNGFLPTSTVAETVQRWRTRDQGDSLTFAMSCADIVGVDFYPRHALGRLGPLALYLEEPQAWQVGSGRRLLEQARAYGGRVMITEGQAEPWETSVVPELSADHWPYSCGPENVVSNYSASVDAFNLAGVALDAYLFWGAEYWVARARRGDSTYLSAFTRVVTSSAPSP